MSDKKNINFALVEDTRPSIYRAMKYWGKKPHNIWKEYIENYTPEGGLYLDPFAGSAISIFEAVSINRRAIGFDLNPLTSFMIEVLSSKFDKDKFSYEASKILAEVENEDIYRKYFLTECPNCKSSEAVAQSFKWKNDQIYEVGVECPKCDKSDYGKVKHWNGSFFRSLREPNNNDLKLSREMTDIKLSFWYPRDEFYKSPSFSDNFKECIGGKQFRYLWTERNLYVISSIFDKINKVKDANLKMQLLFGFIQTIHLCTKMSVPRRKDAKRPFSTSWGRSAYICSSRKMEMNPLLVFESSCFGKQSVESSLTNNVEYLGKNPKLIYVDKSNKSNRSNNFDIKYGSIDITALSDYVDDNSVDFIMTDPPYGGLVQYLDLSSIWLIWLQKVDNKYKPNYDAEITIKKDIQNRDLYEKKFLNGLKQLYRVLKDDGKIVFTFHNKDLQIWNSFLRSLSLARFKIEKVIHQQNKRSGEANVANPYGTSGTDFYIRCAKSSFSTDSIKTDKEDLEHFVITKAIEIIALRNEPTPYQILFNGLLAEISSSGFNLEDFDSNVERFLSKHVGDLFVITDNKENKAGNYWWFVNPDEHIKYRDKKLSERVEETIVDLLRREVAVSLDEALAEVFVKYPNGLTPDIKSVDAFLKKYAYKSNGRWVYKGEIIEKEFTEHTRILYFLYEIGKKLGYEVFIGKREQPEVYKDGKLSNYVDYKNLKFLKGYDKETLKRLEMIDMIWLRDKKIEFAIEVENSTNFTSGIQRGSNLSTDIKKIMVIPNRREKEFKNIKDPLFIDSFSKYNWHYMFYDVVDKLNSKDKINKDNINNNLKHFN